VRLTDEQIELYSRQIILREVGGTGQSALRAARVLVLGTGPAAAICVSYLVGAGVGKVESPSTSPEEAAAADLLPLPEPARRTADAAVHAVERRRTGGEPAAPYDVVLDLAYGTAADAHAHPLVAARLGSIVLHSAGGAFRLALLPRGTGCGACIGLAGSPAEHDPTPPPVIASASAGALAALACCDWLLGIGEHRTARVLALTAGSGLWIDAPLPARTPCPRGCPPPAEPV
jgi:hypothetical protein